MLNICEDVVTFEKKTKISGEFYVSLNPNTLYLGTHALFR